MFAGALPGLPGYYQNHLFHSFIQSYSLNQTPMTIIILLAAA
jgi:hypothetical protein